MEIYPELKIVETDNSFELSTHVRLFYKGESYLTYVFEQVFFDNDGKLARKHCLQSFINTIDLVHTQLEITEELITKGIVIKENGKGKD